MSKILTAEEFKQLMFKNKKPFYTNKSDTELMIEFAKLHVQAALKEASEKAKITEEELGDNSFRETPIDIQIGSDFIADKGYEECSYYRYKSNKDSILNAYPLSNIK